MTAVRQGDTVFAKTMVQNKKTEQTGQGKKEGEADAGVPETDLGVSGPETERELECCVQNQVRY